MKIKSLLHFLALGAALLSTMTGAHAQTTLISTNAVWRYLDNGSDQGTAWRGPAFDDSGWASGVPLFGTETSGIYPWPIRTPMPVGGGRITYYFRTHFAVGSPTFTNLTASGYFDDGAIFYVNGAEAGRVRVAAHPVAFNSLASSASTEGPLEVVNLAVSNLVAGDNLIAVELHQISIGSSDAIFGITMEGRGGAVAPPRLFLNEWLADNVNGVVDPADGQYDDWFEIYNPGTNTVNLAGLYLTDSPSNQFKFQIPPGYTVPPGGYRLVWADNQPEQNSANSPNLHVNFALTTNGVDGQLIGLSAADGTVIDAITIGPQTPDVSEGRWPDGGTNRYFLHPTPGAANILKNKPPCLLGIEWTETDALLYDIDALTGVALNPRNTGLRLPIGLEVDANGDVFTITSQSSWSFANSLVKLDRATGLPLSAVLITVASMSEGDMAICPPTGPDPGWIYFTERNNLYKLDPANAVTSQTFINSVLSGGPQRKLSGIAFNGLGQLFAIDTSPNTDEVFELNPANAAIIGAASTVSVPLGRIVGFDYSPSHGFYVVDSFYGGANRLFNIDVLTGVVTPRPNLTGTSFGFSGLAVAPCLVELPDLWMQDTPIDTGIEPNTSSAPLYVTDDIWVRNAGDTLIPPNPGLLGTPCYNFEHKHQNPVASTPNKVYVKVRNRGFAPSAGGEMLHVYWADASTGLPWPDTSIWTLIGSSVLPVIKTTEDFVAELNWTPPDPASHGGNDHFCLIARIETLPAWPYGMTFAEPKTLGLLWQNVKNNNNIVWKNVTVLTNGPGWHAVLVRNVLDRAERLTLNFGVPEEERTNHILLHGDILVDLGAALLGKWIEGGQPATGFAPVPGTTQIRITDPTNAVLGGLQFAPGETHPILVRFEQHPGDNAPPRTNLTWDIVQLTPLTTNGPLTAVGGERYTYTVAPSPVRLFLNEWLADNVNGVVDPADGQHDDWFEIYNPGTNTVSLDGYFLTDILSSNFKFQIPPGYTVPPGGYRLVWADNQPEQNGANSPDLHVNFVLGTNGFDGVGIALFAPDGTAIDAITFGAQTADVSEGRWPDGGTTRYSMVPTPRAANGTGPVRLDTDSDGIPDDWELSHALNPNDPSDAALDADGDGMTNVQEYLAGTNPADPRSTLRIEVSLNSAGGVRLRFEAMPKVEYAVETVSSLGGKWESITNIPAEAVAHTVDLTLASAGGVSQFYKAIASHVAVWKPAPYGPVWGISGDGYLHAVDPATGVAIKRYQMRSGNGWEAPSPSGIALDPNPPLNTVRFVVCSTGGNNWCGQWGTMFWFLDPNGNAIRLGLLPNHFIKEIEYNPLTGVLYGFEYDYSGAGGNCIGLVRITSLGSACGGSSSGLYATFLPTGVTGAWLLANKLKVGIGPYSVAFDHKGQCHIVSAGDHKRAIVDIATLSVIALTTDTTLSTMNSPQEVAFCIAGLTLMTATIDRPNSGSDDFSFYHFGTVSGVPGQWVEKGYECLQDYTAKPYDPYDLSK